MRLHRWKGSSDRGKKRVRSLLFAVELTLLFKAKATFSLSLKGWRAPIAGSYHSRNLGRVALSTFSQPQIFNKDHATLMILILKYLILITRVSQELQSGVLENFLVLWALEQGSCVHDLKVLEEKFASLNIKEGSELVTMAIGSGLEFKRVFRRIILFSKRPSAVQVAVHGNLRLECIVSEWLQDTVWTVR